MSMLAEPRRKQRVVNLRAGNAAWSEDANKFGQRMLERMGWARGKGLGAREDGVATHVVARYKNDEHGLGYEERNDQWTQHEDQFDALLAELAGGGAAQPPPRAVSLELKSKASRARVHYHKFTRGKDLARYSDKDLANIFGKKSLAQAAGGEDAREADAGEPQGALFTSAGSMHDYFSSKLQQAALGRRAAQPESSCQHIHKNKNKNNKCESLNVNAGSDVPNTKKRAAEAEKPNGERVPSVHRKQKRRTDSTQPSDEPVASPHYHNSHKMKKKKSKCDAK